MEKRGFKYQIFEHFGSIYAVLCGVFLFFSLFAGISIQNILTAFVLAFPVAVLFFIFDLLTGEEPSWLK